MSSEVCLTFESVRTSGASGRILHLATVGKYELAVEKVGVHGWRGWFVENPARKWFVVNGTPEDVVGRMFAATVTTKALTLWTPPALWTLSARQAHYLHKQETVNQVTCKVHKQGGVATNQDVATIKSVPPPVPAAAPIDVQSEVEKLRSALHATHFESRGNWQGASARFSWATKRQYQLREATNGRIVVTNGKHGPQVIVGTIQRTRKTWVITIMGLERALKKFVKAAYPELPEIVKSDAAAAPVAF